jgi:trimethylamine---corrinoid protein Co-methyltransferase
MQRDYVYPVVSDRLSPNQWAEQGRRTIVDRACDKVQQILDTHFPAHIDEDTDRRIRASFPVRLPREKMLKAS